MFRYGKSWSELRSPRTQEDYWVIAVEKDPIIQGLIVLASAVILGLAFYGFCVLVMLFA